MDRRHGEQNMRRAAARRCFMACPVTITRSPAIRPTLPRMVPSPASRTARLKALALDLGFAAVGVAPAVTPPHYGEFLAWLESGYHGEMQYLLRHAEARRHPRHVLDGARSIVVAALPYDPGLPPVDPSAGSVARYAQGEDYHARARRLLRRLVAELCILFPTAHARGIVDTAPLLEREFAQLAGLGWIGKNTMLLRRDMGSWFLLAALVTDAELEYDAPFSADHCGRCTACLDACPTGALIRPRVQDARRCISYLTIELRGSVPEALRPAIGDWFFGCDICQEVCPWNRRPGDPRPSASLGAHNATLTDLRELFALTEADLRAVFRRTSLWRAKRRGLLRNAAIVLGNRCDADAVPMLTRAAEDPDEVVRASAVWALSRIAGTTDIGASPPADIGHHAAHP